MTTGPHTAGVTVSPPAESPAAVYTAAAAQAEAILNTLTGTDCQDPLFDYTPPRNGAFSR